MGRRNHLHDQMRWRAVGMLQAGARQLAAARELNVHHSVIHRLRNHYQIDQNASRRLGYGRRRITTSADDSYLLQCTRRRRTLTAGVAAPCCCRKAHIPPNCVVQTACRRTVRTTACCAFVPAHVRARLFGLVNIAVEHQSNGATYSLRMSLDLISRTIPEGQ
ncbi:hypothetical protein AVEN_129757-1 [Araneus ventricosus]|uniref:Transposase Tc1-like domain-containing protein n=1 Tax=Araneus ventricosus TaxID=182803 RepID=A0A4Y2NSQ0_ARAVE|nr:hypothetical protein AVEN_129757-1 [Araneus ventricosus]